MKHPIRRALLALLLLSAGGSLVSAAWQWNSRQLRTIKALQKKITKADDGRYRVETASWLIETEVSERFTAELAHFMDLFSATVTHFLPGKPLTKQKPTVLIFNDEPSYSTRFSDGSRGQFQYRFEADFDTTKTFTKLHLYSFIQKEQERRFTLFYYPILMHEGTHLLLRQRVGRQKVPRWFDEGLATFFQFWDVRSSVKDNLKKRYARSVYRACLREHFRVEPLSLAALFAIREWNPDQMGPTAKRNYAYAESMLDYLLATKEGRVLFARIFARLVAGEPPVTETEVAALETRWHRHIERILGLKRRRR